MNKKSAINLEVSLAEIILSVLIFAIAGIITLNCFAMARFTEIRADDKTIAAMKVQSAFEYMKSTSSKNEMNDIIKSSFTNVLINENNNITTYTVNYDDNWQECTNDKKKFIMEIKIEKASTASGEIYSINILMNRIKPYPFIKNDGNNIFSISTKKFFPIFNGGGSDEKK